MDQEKDLQQPAEQPENLPITTPEVSEPAVSPASVQADRIEDDMDWLKQLLNQPADDTTPKSDEQDTYQAGLTHLEDDELKELLSDDSQPAVGEPAKTIDDTTAIFNAIHIDNPEESEEVRDEEPIDDKQRKLRPKAKNGYGLFGLPHLVATGIWLALIIAIGISMGRLLWVCCADVMAFGKEDQKVTITITEDDDIDSIAKKLGNANLVRYPGLFKLFATITGKDENISPGTFTLNATLDYNAMINAMVYYGETREVVDIMFPEGATCAQIFKLLADNKVCTVEQLEEYAANGELSNYWFLEGVPRGSKYCLEGYLAPDTYKFYTYDSPRRVLEKFLNEFNSRFTDKMKKDFETIQTNFTTLLRSKGFSEAYIQENTLTVHKIVTLASIIQKETSSRGEGYDISSVFYNRLANKDILTLGADATVHYALGDYFGEIEELTQEHLDFDSPYNTRKNQGIPPGPICNTDVHSLYAALVPNETNYHYFVYDPKLSCHRFAVTYQEHMDNVLEIEKQ